MDARITVITLGVADLERSLRFYRDVLGFQPSRASNEHIAFIQAGGVVLALYPRHLLAADAHLPDHGPAKGFGGFTVAHNVAHREQVDTILEEIRAAGGVILKPAHDAFWGGRSGYFADPDGHAWEVCYNPSFPIGPDGRITID